MKVILDKNIYLNPCYSSIKKNDSISVTAPSYNNANTIPSKAKQVEISHLRAKGINIRSIQSKKIDEGVEKLYTKLQNQLNPYTPNDVERLISAIEENGATRDEALYAMNVLTRYGNMQSLVKLGEIMKALDINRFYRGAGSSLVFNFADRIEDADYIRTNKDLPVATNLAFDYLYNSKHITKLADKDKKNTAVILDDAMFVFLSNNPKELLKLKKDKNCIFINLEGWNNGLNVYTQGKDDKYIINNASKLIKRAKDIQKDENISFENAFKYSVNESVLNRAKILGIEPYTISVNETTNRDINTVVKNLEPMNVSEKYIGKIVNAIGDTIFSNSKKEAQRCKALITDYFLSQVQVYSPRRIGECLKEIHNKILDYASKHYKSDGKVYTEDDIVYFIPSTRKSYDQIYLQYSKVNNIGIDKFIHTPERDFSKFPNDKIYVVIDDIVATGSSMLNEGLGYCMSQKRKMGPNRHIIIAPVISSTYGYYLIKSAIKSMDREGIDEIFTNQKDKTISLRKSAFYNKLSQSYKDMFDVIVRSIPALDYDSYAYEGEAVLFPYMGPDTNSVISSLLFEKMLPNSKALKSQYYSHNNNIMKIKSLIDET